MFHILLLSTLVISASTLDKHILNGELATAGQFPWQAALFVPTNLGLKFCNGALISELWVLTSAECVYGAMFLIRVLLGTTQSTGNDPNQVEIMSHEWSYLNYDPYLYEGDIGLVKLPEAVTFTDYIRPLTLGFEPLPSGTAVTVSGWGQINENGPRVANLTYSNLFTASTDECISFVVTAASLCVAPDPDSDAQNVCVGDNGSPLVVNATTDEPVHVGLVSVTGRCRSNETALFVSTAYYRYWIFAQTGL